MAVELHHSPGASFFPDIYWFDFDLGYAEYNINQVFSDDSVFIFHKLMYDNLVCEPRNLTGLSSCPISGSDVEFLCDNFADGVEFFNTYLKVKDLHIDL